MHCDSLFILFLTEVVLNVLEGNLPIQSKVKFLQYEEEITKLVRDRKKEKISIKMKRNILASNRGLKLLDLLYKPAFDHFDHLQ